MPSRGGLGYGGIYFPEPKYTSPPKLVINLVTSTNKKSQIHKIHDPVSLIGDGTCHRRVTVPVQEHLGRSWV